MLVKIQGRNLVLQTIPKGSTGAEIGVDLGKFSQRILQDAKPQKLYLIDPYQHKDEGAYVSARYGGAAPNGQVTMDARHDRVAQKFQRRIAAGQVEMIRKTSVAAASDIPDDSLDFVYIDGDHTFDGVVSDIKAYLSKVKTGGLIFGDDYVSSGWWGNGVVKGFAKCLHEDPLEIVFVLDRQICCRKMPTAERAAQIFST